MPSDLHTHGSGKPLAVTMGEPAGIGGEVTLKAWLRGQDVPPFFLLDDPARIQALARRFNLAVPIQAIERPEEATAVFASALPVLPQVLAVESILGRTDTANAAAVRTAIDAAVAFTQDGRAAAIVTNPINKQCLFEAGFNPPDHTEYLAKLAGGNTLSVMMLACESLRVVPVTIHMSLQEAVKTLTTERIVATAIVAAESLRRDFAIPRPRLAIAGLNPHAGEGGAMGTEEDTIITPAIEALRASNIDAFGPVSPDTLFHQEARKHHDAAICMYHDQALIPIKTIAFDTAVNITLGLPFVRTSPDHGTALDIADKGIANESSLVAAMNMAASLARRRTTAAD